MKRWHDEDDDIFCSSCCGRAMMAHEAPVYMRTNPFILRGYRQVDTRTFRSTMRALFTLSNETVNIWSHLLGVAALLACMWEWTTAGGARNLRFLEAIAWGAFFASSAACLGASTLFHLHHNCSEEASRCWLQRDLRGIMGCVAGSFLSALYYAFRCDPVRLSLLAIPGARPNNSQRRDARAGRGDRVRDDCSGDRCGRRLHDEAVQRAHRGIVGQCRPH